MPDSPAQPGLTNITVICAHCGQSTHPLAIQGAPSGEASLYVSAQAEMKQFGWELRGDGKSQPYEYVCRVCVERERNAEALPPYSGLDAKCPMCRAAECPPQFARVGGNHLLRTCKVCGYAWKEATARRPWWKFW